MVVAREKYSINGNADIVDASTVNRLEMEMVTNNECVFFTYYSDIQL